MHTISDERKKWGKYLLIGFGVLLVLHIMAIVGVVPPDAVWGGQYTERGELVKMELIAILIVLVAALVVAEFSGIIHLRLPAGMVKVAMYLLLVLFVMSTLGSITSTQAIERYGFSTLALGLAYCCFRALRAN